MDVTDKKFSKLKFNDACLEQLLQEYHPALCIFDPVQDFLPTGVKMNVKNAVRNCMTSLIGLGERYGTAFLIVVHTDNQRPIPGRKKISNSADIWNIGRSRLRVGKTEEKDINYIAHEKSNYSQLGKTVLYRVEDERVVFEGYNDSIYAQTSDRHSRSGVREPVKAWLSETSIKSGILSRSFYI